MFTTRRNVLIRSITGLCGDVAVSVAIASTCVWIIDAASLGFFLSFLLWLLSALASLALSQLVVHPAITAMLSDRKLDTALERVADVGEQMLGVPIQQSREDFLEHR